MSYYGTPSSANKRPQLLDPLIETDHRFVDEFMIDADPAKAAIRAGMPAAIGSALLDKPYIRAAIATAQRLRASRAQVPQDYVLRRWLEVERADPRELVEHWKVPCRACWGVDHQRQYDDHEWWAYVEKRKQERARLEREAERACPNPDGRAAYVSEAMGQDDRGGPGYTILKDPMRGPDFAEFFARLAARLGQLPPTWTTEPNSDHTCPACYGMGISHVIFHDTRHLSPGAAALYKGVKQTKDGIEVLMRNQDEIRQLLARHLNYFTETKVVMVGDANRLTEAELDAAINDELRERTRLLELRQVREGGAFVDAEVGERVGASPAGRPDPE